jgi:hypothetical protein
MLRWRWKMQGVKSQIQFRNKSTVQSKPNESLCVRKYQELPNMEHDDGL